MSTTQPIRDIVKYFETLEDPRIERHRMHSLSDIVFIVVCGAICGAESCRDFVDFAESKLDFIRQYTPLTNGVPSKNTFNRVLSAIDPDQFRQRFSSWVKDFQQELGKVIAIDGKTLRRSFDKASEKSAIHMVSAFASEARLVLAQQKISNKSNEITAIPELIDLLDLTGSIVTLDAMGCQKDIAQKIVDGGGDYVIAVKGNQTALHQEITRHFNNLFDMEHNKFVTTNLTQETNRGRSESRKCLATEHLDWLGVKSQWAKIKSCIALDSKRIVDGKETRETRYYISSLEADAESLNRIIRAHWGVENSLHWIMDVVFGEDQSRVRTGHGAENLSLIKHVALNKLQAAKPSFRKDMSIKRLRKKAGWDNDTLTRILSTEI